MTEQEKDALLNEVLQHLEKLHEDTEGTQYFSSAIELFKLDGEEWGEQTGILIDKLKKALDKQ